VRRLGVLIAAALALLVVELSLGAIGFGSHPRPIPAR
jgi:hypothetical protein